MGEREEVVDGEEELEVGEVGGVDMYVAGRVRLRCGAYCAAAMALRDGTEKVRQ